jgi:2-methylisocitrate lyase-like PEP mutase family enzyme
MSGPELENLGYKIMIHADSALYTVVKAVGETFKELYSRKTTKHIVSKMVDFEEFQQFIRLDVFEGIDLRYRLK